MARLALDHEGAARFVADRAPLERPDFRNFVGLTILGLDGNILAGVVFSDWHPDAKRIEFSAAADSPHAFSPRILGQIAEYVFGQLTVFRVWARTSTDNRRALRFLRGIGFIEESRQAHWYGIGKHCVVLRITPPEWEAKWGSPMKKAA